MAAFLKENGLEKTYLERRMIAIWPEVIGPVAARYTHDLSIREGTLYVHVSSAPLRQELFNNRFILIDRLQQAVGATNLITDIRLLA